jgi:hypothetical protein
MTKAQDKADLKAEEKVEQASLQALADAEPLPAASEVRGVLERGLKILNAFRDADKAVALLENLEQVTNERTAAIAVLQTELDAMAEKVKATEAEMQASKLKAKELVDAAAARAEKHETDAKAYAAKVTKEADERLAKVTAETDALIATCLEKQAEMKDLEKQAAAARDVIAKAEKIQKAMA